jgi:uncharacterized protein YrrD
MTAPQASIMAKLSQTGRTVADPAQDIRGRRVRDVDGEDVGTVDDLLVDNGSGKVRFLRVGHGGILGFGRIVAYLPVELVVSADEAGVRIDSTREHVAPGYDPLLVPEQEIFESLYEHGGYTPFWKAR